MAEVVTVHVYLKSGNHFTVEVSEISSKENALGQGSISWKNLDTSGIIQLRYDDVEAITYCIRSNSAWSRAALETCGTQWSGLARLIQRRKVAA